jgi:flagellar export protein FliJ
MSPSFRFSLERVRVLRERHEDAAKEALAGAVQDQLRSERGVREAADAVLQAQRAHRDASDTPMGVQDLIARQAWLERSEQVHRASQELLGRSERQVQERRDALTEAARDRQALERLKEHRRSDHERELARQETIALDEIAINGFRRRAA